MTGPTDSLEDLGNDGAKLRRLGFTDFEQVIQTVPVAEQALSSYLGRPIRDALGLPAQSFEIRSQAAAFGASGAGNPLGAWVPLDTVARLAPLPPSPPPDQPADQLNYIEYMPPLKDQGQRETCVAFASVAVLEHSLRINGSYKPMSEQFMYWLSKNLDGGFTQPGSRLKAAFLGLQTNGCCTADVWGYNPNRIAGDEPQPPPPSGAVYAARAYTQSNIKRIWPTSVKAMQAQLQARRCVAVTVPLFPSSYGTPGSARRTYTQRTGDFLNPIPGEKTIGGHAMCIVGYIDMLDQPENGYGRFIVRNSWSPTAAPPQRPWATSPNWGLPPGYGTISYMYIRLYGAEAYSIA